MVELREVKTFDVVYHNMHLEVPKLNENRVAEDYDNVYLNNMDSDMVIKMSIILRR